MQTHFLKTEHLILLTESELKGLLSAKNREVFQPGLKAFLYAIRNLKGLRRLAFGPGDKSWSMPRFSEKENDGRMKVFDENGRLRGFRQTLPLPARPGEPQMRLSYDWFWSEFCNFLHEKQVWAYTNETELTVVVPAPLSVSLEKEWKNFWERISSAPHLRQSLDIFLDNKTLFKNQAKPWDSKDIPILSEDMARYLLRYYQHGKSRKRHFKQGSIPKAISDLEEIVRSGQYNQIPLNLKQSDGYVLGGDFHTTQKHIRCAACGQIIPKKEGLERLAIFLKNADERPQSGNHKDQKNRYCRFCVATVFLCPVKLAPETLTVRFHSASSGTERSVEMELRKFVAQSLHVHAGNFISLHLTESIDRKPLSQAWGAYHYALWKMAVTFPPELFAQQFDVEVYPGEETFMLPGWALWLVSSLAGWDNVFQYNCYASKENRPRFSQFLRLVSRKKIFQAFYVLISGGVIPGYYAQTWKINALQEIWSGFENILRQNIEKEEDMPIPDYPRIAGFAGLLLPMAERVQSSKKDPNDKKVAVGKLLEEVDRPIQYAYTAARESGSTDFIFCQRPRNRYFFEKAMDLLEWAGEDVERLKAEGEKKADELAKKDEKTFGWLKEAEQKVFLCSDQIARVTSALVCEGENPPYENEADWRAFAYQVKLALWSMFPTYLGPKDQK